MLHLRFLRQCSYMRTCIRRHVRDKPVNDNLRETRLYRHYSAVLTSAKRGPTAASAYLCAWEMDGERITMAAIREGSPIA